MTAPNTAAEIGREGLLALAARVEAATGADRELDCAIAVAVNAGSLEGAYKAMSDSDDVIRAGYVQHHFNGVKSLQETRRYTASLDAAMSLVPEDCYSIDFCGFQLDVSTGDDPPEMAQRWSCTVTGAGIPFHKAYGATKTLALLSAALKARAVGEQSPCT